MEHLANEKATGSHPSPFGNTQADYSNDGAEVEAVISHADNCSPSFANEPQQTDKTDETDNPSNQEFLEALFGAERLDVRPIIVSFAGNPNDARKAAWFGRPWENDGTPLSGAANNYFSLATFRPDDSGQYRRLKKQFAALHAVMLDDVGTKVPRERVTLHPSWEIETSPGNYQVGYILAEPLKDGIAADRLMNAIVKAQLCDPGANGPTARLARLPVAVNGKHQSPFQCRMGAWRPDLRYTAEEMVESLELEMLSPSTTKKRLQRQHIAHSDDGGNGVTIPRPTENAVLAALRLRGLYKMPLGSGKHDITCPWVEEHTSALDSGTAYFEPSDSWPIGGFKCQHGHCNHRRMRDFLEYLSVNVKAARMKATIRVTPGEIHRVVDAAEEQLALTGRHYQRGGLIITVVTDPGTKATRIQESNQPSLVQALAGASDWQRYDGRSEDWVAIDPPARHVGVLYDSPNYSYLPVLNGLARQPYLREDDTLVTTAGYDSVSGMFGIFAAKEFSVPEFPTKEQAEAALIMLGELLDEFSFASEADRSAALLAILTATVRPRLPFAPMIHIKAHQVGSGKSYLCQLITIFATPQHGTPGTFPKDDEECRKMLLAELLRGPAVIEFDNLTSDLMAHKSLCIALTSEYMTDRILGVSKTATVSTRTLFLSSGNNVGPVQDMTRRCVTIHLDPACETPAIRTFKRPELIQEVKQQRGLYVSAALTIIRAWIAAGRPRTECPALAGFDEWSKLCRQPLLWLGCEDPVKSVFEAMADDPDRDTLGRLLKAWHSCFGNKATMVREVLSTIQSAYPGAYADLNEVVRDIAEERGEINRLMFGRWIKRHSGRIVDKFKFVPAGGSRSASAWCVESVSSVL
jgi:hypothetical protein